VVHFSLNILEDTDQGGLLIAVPFNDFAHCLQIDWHLSLSPAFSEISPQSRRERGGVIFLFDGEKPANKKFAPKSNYIFVAL
jgi:hypothetical protein